MSKLILTMLFLSAVVCAQAPAADHHQHVFSPAMAEFQKIVPITSADVVKHLDEAGIKQAVLLSSAYSYGRPGREPQNEYEKVREENDWVGAQAAQYPKRLIAFCGLNPQKDYAVQEIERCAKNPNTRHGIKLHIGNSDVQLEDPQHIEKLKAVFRAANANRMAIVIHVRASFSLNRPFGPEQARAFVEQVLAAAPNVTVQIAHLGSSGPGYLDPKVDAFMDTLLRLLYEDVNREATAKSQGARRKSKMPNVWFDLTTIIHPNNTPERSAMVLKRIRQIGVKRIVYGSDAALSDNLKPRESWAEVAKLGLSAKELKTIANNRAPYFDREFGK